MHRRFTYLLALLASLVPIISFFTPIGRLAWLKTINTNFDSWMVIISGFALLLGVVSIIQVNLHKIKRKGPGWGYSVIVLLSLFIMAFLGTFLSIDIKPDGSRPPFVWIFENVFNPLQATMFSMTAFFIASAAFRAFRIRNTEACIMIVGALIIMLGRIPTAAIFAKVFGEFPVIYPFLKFFDPLTEWIMTVPSMAAQRGILIGASLGAASMCIRVILGIERPYMGKVE
jgi:hypothetical protein